MNGALPRGLQPETAFTGVSIDSRRICEGDLFVAIEGLNHDGHDFVFEALQQGAVAAVVKREWLSAQKRRSVRGLPLIVVQDTIEALQALSLYHRQRLGLPVIAVTGSNGKTTTKEMISSVLRTRYRALRSEGSFNNHIGVPLTLLRLRRSHEVAVVEMGMNHPGEIARLCAIAEPTAGVITNVGAAHLEFMGDLDAVAYEKAELAEAIGPHGFLVLNADDSRVAAMGERTEARIVTFGLEQKAEIRGEIVEFDRGIYPVFRCNGGPAVRLQVPGVHNVMNALAAAAVGEAMGCSPEQVGEGLESYEGSKWRTEMIEADGILVLNDSYNANPVSVSIALRLLHDWENARPHRRVAVLGDMLELGRSAPRSHRSLGEEVVHSGVELLIAVGDYAPEVIEGALEAGFPGDGALASGDVDEAWIELGPRLEPGDLVLVKGSRRIGLERIVDYICSRHGDPHPAGEEG
ncbi:MAG: UDP-N-acetylmuramoyl-tripeptide--D-alanyl-D-alanine ligase [Candidatus Latescibacteria bacterium]|nr:UDP-N-acetylmuramoyl-tripeptide--D-alanyl-D-alanine ligase [Candidatus Latescibacterota bacterium]